MAEPKAKRSTAKDLAEEFKTGKSRKRTTKTEEKAEAKPDANIKTNTFYKILFDSKTTAQEKKEAIEKALTFEGTKAENAERISEFEALKQYLQLQRQRMAKEFMNLADTKSFAELKDVIEEMNAGLIDFDNKMKPLAEILDAVYTLRTGGDDLVMSAYQDIEADKEAEAAKEAELAAAQAELERIQQQIRNKENDIADKREDKGFFGFGKIKKSAQQGINRAQNDIRHLQGNAQEVAERLEQIAAGGSDREDLLPAEFADAKAKLRDLLDISSEEHTERQRALVDAARNFVEHAQERTGSVLVHLEGMDKRIENVSDANNALRSMYAIMDDASKGAAETNKTQAEDLKGQREADGLSSIAAMELDDKITAVNDHITNLDRTAVDTSTTLNDLSEQGGRIVTMKDRNRNQIAKTRSQMTSGIGGVADRLVGVLTAVSQASLSESSELMGDSIAAMDAKTRAHMEQEVFQKVLGQKLQNDDLAQALEEAAEFKDVLARGTELYKTQVAETHELVAEMSVQAESMREVVDAAKGAHADARDGVEAALDEEEVANDNAAASEADDDLENPFASLG